MELLKVNQELCTKCGICTDTCPVGVISMGLEGPKTVMSMGCIACGHCVAVCPQTALDHVKVPLVNQVPLTDFPVIDRQKAAVFLRSRRSIRRYQTKPVPQELMLDLLDIARFAPTGGNSQGLSYIVINNKEILKQITAVTIDWFEEQLKAGVDWVKGYAGLVKVYRETNIDVILRDAPCLILATAPLSFILGRDSARYALEYVELYATTFGLGTCWAGFVELCAGANYPAMRQVMNLPEGYVVIGAMMAGYPKYTYKRLVDRKSLQVTWIN